MPSFGYGVAPATPQSRSRVRLVLAEQRLGRPVAGQRARAERVVLGDERAVLGRIAGRASVERPTTTCCGTTASAGRGASPPRGRRCGRATRMQMSSGVGLRVVDGDVPVAVVVEDAGVEQLELGIVAAARAVLVHQLRRTGTRPAGRRSASASTSASAWSRGTTSTPWRPRRGSPADRSGRRCAPSGSGRGRSRTRTRSTASAGRRRCRPGRPRSSGTRASGRGRGGRSPRSAVGL